MTWLTFALLACEESTGDTAAESCTDEDGDGWCAGSPADPNADCNDHDARAYPGAASCDCDCDRAGGITCGDGAENVAGCA